MASSATPAPPQGNEPPADGPVAPGGANQRQQQGHNNQRNNGGRGRGGRGRGQGGRGRQQYGRGQNQQGRGEGPTSVAPTSGVPYGHVPGYLPGSSSLVEELDKNVLIVLRDGRHLVGILRSFDQFSNLVLDEASERRIHRDTQGDTYFADVPLGIYIVRGDSMVLMGKVADEAGEQMKKVELSELEEMVKKGGEEKLEWDFDKDLLA